VGGATAAGVPDDVGDCSGEGDGCAGGDSVAGVEVSGAEVAEGAAEVVTTADDRTVGAPGEAAVGVDDSKGLLGVEELHAAPRRSAAAATDASRDRLNISARRS
jgi:hypothetical protein